LSAAVADVGDICNAELCSCIFGLIGTLITALFSHKLDPNDPNNDKATVIKKDPLGQNHKPTSWIKQCAICLAIVFVFFMIVLVCTHRMKRDSDSYICVTFLFFLTLIVCTVIIFLNIMKGLKAKLGNHFKRKVVLVDPVTKKKLP